VSLRCTLAGRREEDVKAGLCFQELALGPWQGVCPRMLGISSRPENKAQEAWLFVFCSNLKLLYFLKRCLYYFINNFPVIILVFFLLFVICLQKLENSNST